MTSEPGSTDSAVEVVADLARPYGPVMDPAGPVVDPDTTVVHVCTLVDSGPFVVARCACGWRSYARRSRPLARREAQDHLALSTTPLAG